MEEYDDFMEEFENYYKTDDKGDDRLVDYINEDEDI